ncbi:hypothetical protein BA768_07350 [Chryseobacterium sp. CBo1]|uniref:hypothetical protein n=1 Tax=Chryseobacterium sp. CBo1 TaxID=1869230 RepID=UPI000810A9A9|nr:hypothetical protein [Chryseobacterium sp. CBo1]OCK49707.1 hypothetical protein BA768_07350 [Chryseobacterium sp. CBo1]
MKKAIIFLSILSGLSVNAQSSWSLTGNSGTNASTNFLGTIDNQDLVFKTNNIERLKLDKQGKFAVGDIDPNYQSTFNGKSKFDIHGEWENAFVVYNNSPNEVINIRVDTDSQTVFLQEQSGRVVIGAQLAQYTSNYDGYKLFVKDGIRTEKVQVDIATQNGWADYVFAKDYKLMPLKELDQFINTNGHLPEVPTTEEAIKNGIELKEMNILLLKKIEELTLYTIEQQKRIEALEKKIQ